MKKFTAILLAALMLLAFSSCKGEKDTDIEESTSASTEKDTQEAKSDEESEKNTDAAENNETKLPETTAKSDEEKTEKKTEATTKAEEKTEAEDKTATEEKTEAEEKTEPASAVTCDSLIDSVQGVWDADSIDGYFLQFDGSSFSGGYYCSDIERLGTVESVKEEDGRFIITVHYDAQSSEEYGEQSESTMTYYLTSSDGFGDTLTLRTEGGTISCRYLCESLDEASQLFLDGKVK